MKRFFAEHKQYLLIIGAVIMAFIFRNMFSGTNVPTMLKDKNPTSDDFSNPPSDEELGILHIVAEAPRFPGCEDLLTVEEKKKCADQKMLKYLYDHIEYPQYAKDHNIEGRCVITFVVEPDGMISNAKIIRDIGGGCGEVSLKIVNSMNELPQRWIPGIQNGNKVRVRFNLPVSFRLQPGEEPPKQ